MYLRDVKFKNYGALKDMKYTFQFNADGTPKPTVFMGKNGVGKTLLLSNITHSLIEIKRGFYQEISDVSGQSYYRMGSKHYISDSENEAYSKIDYDNGANYTDLMVKDYEAFKMIFDVKAYDGVDVNDRELRDNGFFIKVKKPLENVFKQEVFLYFPVERYYVPTWINEDNKPSKFIYNSRNVVGKNNDSIIQYNLLENIESWILEVAIDQALYEKAAIPERTGNADGSVVYKSGYIGKNTNIINIINRVLQKIYSTKLSKVRFVITPKNYGRRQIKIVEVNKEGDESVIVPQFTNLSSGEVMLLGMIATILRECDKISMLGTMSFETISGIVLIDEIDLHLHSDLLRNILPDLMSMFPRIQFIVTSHSPFFLLGMKDKFKDKCNFVTLPTGTITNQIEQFDEIERCYAVIDESYKDILTSLKEVRDKLVNVFRPLIITEGKTDWKHISNALSMFKSRGQFYDLDVDFLEYDNELGDAKLKSLLENLAKIPHSHKIIGVFDSDDRIGRQYAEIKDFGNNVYACCIEDVQGYGCGISIELLYTRDDLKLCDDDGRRLYLSDEFKEKSHQLKGNNQIICTNPAVTGAYKSRMLKIIDNGVFDSEEKSLALSKSDFADNVYSKKGNFGEVNVDGFKNIINTISTICSKF